MSDVEDIKDVCLRLLARREHSRKELLNKCLVKGYGEHQVLAAIDGLVEQGLQDDLRYAESYARHRILKGYGPVFISYQLQHQGVGAVDLDSIVETVAGSWMDVLGQVYSKKYRHSTSAKVCKDRHEWAKRSRFLMQRGFPAALVNALYVHLNSNNPKF
ncbi:MAG: regulatory protein RecX [Methylovulum sp.]|nr:regulatory protein RecX [Methylovulum sp.]